MYDKPALTEAQRWSQVTALVKKKLATFENEWTPWEEDEVRRQYNCVKRNAVLPNGLYKYWTSGEDDRKVKAKIEEKITEYRELEKQMKADETV